MAGNRIERLASNQEAAGSNPAGRMFFDNCQQDSKGAPLWLMGGEMTKRSRDLHWAGRVADRSDPAVGGRAEAPNPAGRILYEKY